MRIHFPLAAVSLVLLSFAGPARAGFERTYGGPGFDQGKDVLQMADGGFAIAGCTDSFGAGSKDAWLIRTDAAGDTLWTRTFGGGAYDEADALRQTTDGGFVLAGLTYSFGAGGGDVWLIRTDAAGDTLWTRTFGGDELDWGASVEQTTDGGFIVVGATNSFGASTDDVYLIKTDGLGITEWARSYGGFDTDTGLAVRQTEDGGYIVAGSTRTFGAGESDAWLIRTNAAGDPFWMQPYGESGTDAANDVEPTADGGFLLAGETWVGGPAGRNAWLVQADSLGVVEWDQSFGGNGADGGSSVAPAAGGGFVLTGYTESYGAGGRDLFLLRTDARGDLLWLRTFGGAGWEWGRSVARTAEGGYVIAGETESTGAGGRDVYLVVTDADGRVGIEPGGSDSPRGGGPRVPALRPNYPNPFTPSTTVAFEIPGDAPEAAPGGPGGDDAFGDLPARPRAGEPVHVRLSVYDVRGRRIRRLVDGLLDRGMHRVVWDGRDDEGRPAPSGIYIARLEVLGSTLSRKMILLE